MSYRRLLTITWTLVLLLIANLAFAEVPQIINYQGRLTETDGTPIDGTELIKFKIYGSESGDDSLWWRGFVSVDVNNGFFDYQLGSLIPLPDDLFSTGTERWLGITVGTDSEISPRTEITSMGYSFHTLRSDSSGYATDIADGIVTESKISNYSVTEMKIADNSVHSSHIQEHSIIGNDIGYEEITGDNIDDGTIGFEEISTIGVADGEIMKLVGGNWTAAADDAGAGGDITAVIAGDALVGGATSGEATLAVGNGAITTTKIADDAVTLAKIADDAVTAANIETGAVHTEEIADGTIISNDIATDAIGSDEIATDAVGASEIATDAVHTEEIADGTIISSDIASDAVGSDEIATDAVGASEIATDAVGSDEIVIGSVTSNEIAENTVINADISDTADISVYKINGTAVNLSSPQTIAGTKTFDNDVYFGDSTIRINNDGIIVGDNDTPDPAYLMDLGREYDTPYTRYGLYTSMTNNGSGNLYGLRGYCYSNAGGTAYAVRGSAYSDATRYGVYGYAIDQGAGTGNSYALYGTAYNGVNAYGVFGYASSATYNYGGYFTPGLSKGSVNYAGYFNGDVATVGRSLVGSGGFKIDHPLNPDNQYLIHSDVESPEMMNIYNGNITLDANGEAIVELPDYFEALNKDFRYQLTPIGSPAPNLYVANRIEGNRFTIAGGEPFMEVSWQVSGIRNDAFANSNRSQVEIDKLAVEKGLYLHPESFGFDETRQIHYEQNKKAEENMEGSED